MDELFVEIPVEENDLDMKSDIAVVEDELDVRWVPDSSAETVAAAPVLVPAGAVGTVAPGSATVVGTVAGGKTGVAQGAGNAVAGRPDCVEAVVHPPVQLAAGSAQAVGTVERAVGA